MNKIRQVAPELSGIRDDHVARYQFAINEMLIRLKGGKVLDVGCGVGYGSRMMSDAGFDVAAIDPSQEAIDYANRHYYGGRIKFIAIDMEHYMEGISDFIGDRPMADFITIFEVIEHTDKAPAFLAEASSLCGMLFGSVPNDDVVPFTPGKANPEHYRHYTPKQITDELEQSGWSIEVIGSQCGKHGNQAVINTDNTNGRTIVFMAKSKHV